MNYPYTFRFLDARREDKPEDDHASMLAAMAAAARVPAPPSVTVSEDEDDDPEDFDWMDERPRTPVEPYIRNRL